MGGMPGGSTGDGGSSAAGPSDDRVMGGGSMPPGGIGAISPAPLSPPVKTETHSVQYYLRHKLASDVVEELKQILQTEKGESAKALADNQSLVVNAAADVQSRVRTFLVVVDWPDGIARGTNYEYPRDSVLLTARSFFYATSIKEAPETVSKMLSVGVLAQLKGDTKSKEYETYLSTGEADLEWKKGLQKDWPGKKAAIQRFIDSWLRYPLRSLREQDGVPMGIAEGHFVRASFVGAPEDFYDLTVGQDFPHLPGVGYARNFYFASLPPWWNDDVPAKVLVPPQKTKDTLTNWSFLLQHKLASEMVEELKQIVDPKKKEQAVAMEDNHRVMIVGDLDFLTRAKTYIRISDWPDGISRQSNYQYPRGSVMHATRSFFYATSIQDAPEYFSELLSPRALAELKGDTKSAEYETCVMGGAIDANWEKALRADWPGKAEVMQRLVKSWNKYSLQRLRESSGVAIGFGVKHFVQASFDGDPSNPKLDFSVVDLVIVPDRRKNDAGEQRYLFDSLPPWWKEEAAVKAQSKPEEAKSTDEPKAVEEPKSQDVPQEQPMDKPAAPTPAETPERSIEKPPEVPNPPTAETSDSPFQLRQVLEATDPSATGRKLATKKGKEEVIYVGKTPALDHTALSSATAKEIEGGQWGIELLFNDDGAKLLAKVTEENLQRQLAMFVNGDLIVAPKVQEVIREKLMVTGIFTQEEARSLASKIQAAITKP